MNGRLREPYHKWKARTPWRTRFARPRRRVAESTRTRHLARPGRPRRYGLSRVGPAEGTHPARTRKGEPAPIPDLPGSADSRRSWDNERRCRTGAVPTPGPPVVARVTTPWSLTQPSLGAGQRRHGGLVPAPGRTVKVLRNISRLPCSESLPTRPPDDLPGALGATDLGSLPLHARIVSIDPSLADGYAKCIRTAPPSPGQDTDSATSQAPRDQDLEQHAKASRC